MMGATAEPGGVVSPWTSRTSSSSIGEHDAAQHLFARQNPIVREEAFRNRGVKTGVALDG